MKIHELLDKSECDDLLEHVQCLFANDTYLNEGILSNLQNAFVGAAQAIKRAWAESNKKSTFNDNTLSELYKGALTNLSTTLSKLPQPVKTKIETFLAKYDIKFSGVDISRNNFKRYCVVQVTRALLALTNLPERILMTLVDAFVSGGTATLINVLMNAKDSKSLFGALKELFSHVKKITAANTSERQP